MKVVIIEQLGKPNKNGRLYDIPSLKHAIDKANSTCMGRIGMPESFDLNISEISHKIENLRFENNNLIGDLVILDTPQGRKMIKMMESTQLVFRTAGVGTISSSNDGTKIVKDYEILSVNAISSSDAA